MEPFSFRTPIAIPDIGAEAGDWIDYHPEDPQAVYVIKEVPRRLALETFTRLRSLSSFLPDPSGDDDARRPPLRRLK